MKFASTTLVFVVSALLAVGLVMLYSATMFHRGGPFWLELGRLAKKEEQRKEVVRGLWIYS